MGLEEAVSKRISAATGRKKTHGHTKPLPLNITTLAELTYEQVLQSLSEQVLDRLKIGGETVGRLAIQVEVLDADGKRVTFERIRVTLAPKPIPKGETNDTKPPEEEGGEGESA